jgi:hypothetical protein
MREAIDFAKNAIHNASAKLRNVLRLLIQAKSTEAFAEWRAVVVRRHKSEAYCRRRRLENAVKDWTSGMIEQLELFRAVAVKCSHFLALITGQNVVNCFHIWKRITENKRNCAKLRKARQEAYLASLLGALRAHKDQRKLDKWLLRKVGMLFRSVMGGFFSDDKKGTCFQAWWTVVAKKKKAMAFWRGNALAIAWDAWMEIMQAVWAIKDKVKQKCANVLALIAGDACKSMLSAWKVLVDKNKRAIKRWSSQSLLHALTTWRHTTHLHNRVRKLHKSSLHSWDAANKRWSLTTWAVITDERLYFRALMHDALRVWMHMWVIRAFRLLDEHARTVVHHRKVVASFRRRFEMRPAQVSLRLWRRVVAHYARRRHVLQTSALHSRRKCLLRVVTHMRDQVLDRKLVEAEERARNSDVLLRLKRYVRACMRVLPGWLQRRRKEAGPMCWLCAHVFVRVLVMF